jgi:hypothetical protein
MTLLKTVNGCRKGVCHAIVFDSVIVGERVQNDLYAAVFADLEHVEALKGSAHNPRPDFSLGKEESFLWK